MAEEREAKRARQACLSCRRKKTRCSGEKPACAFCVRLGQRCEYSNGNSLMRASSDAGGLGMLGGNDPDLASRVALLESRLGISRKDASPNANTGIGSGAMAHLEPSTRLSEHGHSSRTGSSVEASDETSKFHTIPALPVLKALTDGYFRDCHNQPYCYFLERVFRQRIEDGTLPEYLLLAFVATAARYSTHPFFEGRQSQAIEIYARNAWRIVLQQVFSSEQGLDIHAIQATNLLAIIDFTAGQHRLGWVKIGLAVRFAQGLRLNAEPDQTLPYWEQEERRRLFWSVYILDRFVSCCRGRVPSILDMDCTVRLPSSEEDFRMEVSTETPTIAVLKELPEIERCKGLDHFALFVLVSSILGRTVRYCLQQNTNKGYPPWDSRSDFARISSILFSFEALLTTEGYNFADLVYDEFGTYEGFDRQKAAHFIWCRALYHVCCCLLQHPLLLHRYLQQYRHTFPRSFARECLRRCQEHAEQLTGILKTVQERNCCSRASFMGYFAVVASSVHRLFEHSADLTLKTQSIRLSKTCLGFLEQLPMRWDNYSRMATALREFEVAPSLAEALILPSVTDESNDKTAMDNLWRILDYGWLSDSSRTDTPLPATPMNADVGNWDFFDDLIGKDIDLAIPDPNGQGSNLATYINNSRNKDWWYHLGSGQTPQNYGYGFNP